MKLSKLLKLFGKGKTVSKTHIRNLIEMARADGKVDDTENELLLTIAQRYEISPAVINRLDENNYEVSLEVPEDDKEKFEQFFELVQMMMADNFMHEDELNLCYFFALRYGYKKDKVEEIVTEAVNAIKEGKGCNEAWVKAQILTQG